MARTANTFGGGGGTTCPLLDPIMDELDEYDGDAVGWYVGDRAGV